MTPNTCFSTILYKCCEEQSWIAIRRDCSSRAGGQKTCLTGIPFVGGTPHQGTPRTRAVAVGTPASVRLQYTVYVRARAQASRLLYIVYGTHHWLPSGAPQLVLHALRRVVAKRSHRWKRLGRQQHDETNAARRTAARSDANV